MLLARETHIFCRRGCILSTARGRAFAAHTQGRPLSLSRVRWVVATLHKAHGRVSQTLTLARLLILPKILESLGRQLGVFDRVLNVFVPEIMLKRPSILTIICKLVAAGVAQHVGMDWERHLGGLAEPTYHAPEPDGTHGCPPLTHEKVSS